MLNEEKSSPAGEEKIKPDTNPEVKPESSDTTQVYKSTENSETTPPAVAKKSGGKSKWLLAILAAIILIAIAGIGGYLIKGKTQTPTPVAVVSPTPENQAVACTMDAKACPDGSYVSRQGPKCEFAPCPTGSSSSSAALDKTYTSKEGDWQIDYPTKVKAEARNSTQIGPNGIGTPVVFSMLGPTQGSGTEFHDGISYTVGVVKKPAATSLQKFAEEQTAPNPEVGSTNTPLKAISVNGLSGYETITSGLGEFKIIFLSYPGNQEKVYYMAIFSDGPGTSNAQYDETTEAMFKSFKNTK